MEKIKVSVILPTYNRMKLLRKQVQALLNQTIRMEDFEVLIVNDGSSDGTKEYLDGVQKNCSNNMYSIIRMEASACKNTTLAVARGSIIAFTDDDCEVNEDWLAIILREFKSGLVGLQGLTYTDRGNTPSPSNRQ